MMRKDSDEASAASTVPEFVTVGNTKMSRYSSVWDDFEFNAGGHGGAAPTATCRWCDKTLRAGGRNGTSHLRRHANNTSCRARAEERRRQPTASSSGDQELEQDDSLYFVDGFNIPQLFEELERKGLVHMDHQASEDAHFRPDLPQAANSSSRWFFQKARERKRTDSNKRRIREGFIGQDQLSPPGDFSFKEKKMQADSSIHAETRTTSGSGDYSYGNSQ